MSDTGIKKFDYTKGTPGLGDFLRMLENHRGMDWNIIIDEKISRFSSLLWGVSNYTIDGLNVSKGMFKFSEREINRAFKMIGPEPAIVINPNCRKESGPHRELPDIDWDGLAYDLKGRFNIFQFGLSSNITRIKYATQYQDLDIRELAAAYTVILRYAGVDSGERHLCHAVGGTSWVIRPRGIEAVYNYERWTIDSPRFHYYFKEEFEGFKNDILAS